LSRKIHGKTKNAFNYAKKDHHKYKIITKTWVINLEAKNATMPPPFH